MITNIDVLGFIIKVEDNDGVVKITAEKDGDVVEELSLDPKEFEEGTEAKSGEDIKNFNEFSGEENEVKEEETEEDEKDEEEESDEKEEDEKDEDEEKNESIRSFSKFFNKKK